MTGRVRCESADAGKELRIDASIYMGEPRLRRVKRELAIRVGAHCFLPRVDDLAGDWVGHVSIPAFRLLREQRAEAVTSFCSIGTGSGLDVLGGIEIFGPTRVGLTDVHEEVVAAAVENVRRNTAGASPPAIEAGAGDLLEPLRRFAPSYDVIYENLPNVPAASADEVAADRTSSTHVPPRTEPVPALVKQQLLDLHFIALQRAREFLAPGGVVLSALGARVPLEHFLGMSQAAGFSGSFLTYTWKVQAEGESVIRDHAAKQREGFGPFHFYPAAFLRERFRSVELSTSGSRALEIERALAPERLDAAQAWESFRRGDAIGHTAVVLKSVPR
ncbi:MAG: hypothetical protein WCC48_18570 [Anaeromyxobacteraceae bacterium]